MIELPLVTLGAAFLGGLLMFLAPCTLPLVPVFLASLVSKERNSISITTRLRAQRAVLFSVGFTSVFVLFGVLTGIFGSYMVPYKTLLSRVGGVIVIIFGLSLLGVFSIRALQRVYRVTITSHVPASVLPFLLGASFASGWTPCAGPILASILLLATTTTTVSESALLLSVFSLGLAIPFMLTGIFGERVLGVLFRYPRLFSYVERTSGIFLILFGLLLVFGELVRATELGFALYAFMGYVPICTYF